MYQSVRKKLKVSIAKLVIPLMILPVIPNFAVVANAESIDPSQSLVSCNFEDQTAQGFTARGSAKVTVTNEANHTQGGAYSLKVEGRTSTWHGAQINLASKIKRGDTYDVTAWVKLISPDSCTLKLTGQVGGSSYPNISQKTVSAADGWVKLEGTVLYTDSTTDLAYVESDNATASYYIDDVNVVDTGAPNQLPDPTKYPALKDIYKDDFLLGNVPGGDDLNPGTTKNDFFKYHYNVVTPGNEMKPDATERTKGNYTYTSADNIVSKALAQGMKVHGHTLVWHSQTPAWFNQQVDSNGNAIKDASGNPIYLSRDEALANMKEHIENVMEHFGNKVISWDVVNEVMADGPAYADDWRDSLRKSPWYYSIGTDYVEQAFLMARAVLEKHPDWNIKLYYNDFNDDFPAKSDAMYKMVKELNANYQKTHPGKLLIDGIGMQSHYNMTTDPKNVEASIEKFSSLGVEISISEVDVLAGMNYSLSNDWAEKQANLYAQLFKIYKKHADAISRVTIWGYMDNESWRSSQNPLIFTSSMTPKPAFFAIEDPDKFLAGKTLYTPPATKSSFAVYGKATIDGTIDDAWNSAPEIPINTYMMATAGASGTAKVLWDEKNLYVLYQVKDTQLDKSNSTPANQDSVEAFVDEDKVDSWPYRADDGDYRVNYANGQSFKFLSNSTPATSEGFESAAVTSGTNYVVEMKIPFKTITPTDGTKIRFDAAINDAANGKLQSIAQWNDIIGRDLKDTSYFGNLTLLVKPEKINDITASIEEGQAYTLPATVTASYSDGTKKEVAVKWNPASVDTSKAGTYTFKGSVEGYDKEVILTLTVNAKPIVISSIENVTANVEEGQAYTLPTKVTATYSDGTKKEVPVKWDPSSVDTSKAGTYTFKGSVEGYDKAFALTLTVNAKPIVISSIENITASVEQGKEYILPSKVTATYSDGAKKEVSVKWNPASADTSKAGTYTFKGSVDGYDKEVVLTLTVNSKPEDTTKTDNNSGNNSGKTDNSTTPATSTIVNAKSNSVVSKDIFNAVKGIDKTVRIEANNVVWEFNGKDINSTVTSDIDFSLKDVSSDLKNKEIAKVKSVLGKDVAIAPFSFKYDGSLPGTAKVTLPIGTSFAGKTVAIYRYFADKNTYEYVTEAATDSNGYITISLNHCSDYFAMEKSNDIKMPKTGSVIDFNVLVASGLILTIFGLAIMNKKRVRRFMGK